MTTIKIGTLRSQLAECVRLAASGKDIFNITCHGRVLAQLKGVATTGEEDSQGTEASGTSESVKTAEKFMVPRSKSQELRALAEKRLHELEEMDLQTLTQEFINVTSIYPSDRLLEHELRTAIARIYQVHLWVDQMGAVPEDIALRDLMFWFKLFRSLCSSVDCHENQNTSIPGYTP